MVAVDRIQGLSGSLAIKTPARVATTAAISLSGEQTIDGVAVVEGDRVLVKDQTATAENGIYNVSTGTWTRALDFDGANDVADGTLVLVGAGAINAELMFKLDATAPIVIGTTALAFTVSAVFNDQVNAHMLGGPGEVTMIRTGASSWLVYDNNGDGISVAGSTTGGLQEAIDYATDNGLNLRAIGGGTSRTADYGILNCTTGLVFPPLRDMRVSLEGVHVAFGAAVTGTGISFDSCMQLDFQLMGEVTYQGTGAAVQLKPTNAIPVDTMTVATGSRFYIGGIATTGGTPAALLDFDVSAGSIIGNTFEIGELVGSGAVGSPALAAFGLRVTGPTASTAFYANIVDIANIHDCTDTCVQEGVNTTNQDQIACNIYRIGQLEPKGTNAQGWNGFGTNNQIQIGNIASAAGGTMDYGVIAQSGSTKNIFNIGKIVGAGTASVNDLGTLNSFKYNGITSTPVEVRTPLAFAGTWGNAGAGQPNLTYWKDPYNVVHLEGYVTGGGADLICTLPAGYLPQNAQQFPAVANNVFASVLVAVNGDVSSTSHTNLSLNGICFRRA